MFTLGAGKTLAASGPTAVNFFVFGDAVTTTDAFDILAKGSVSVAATVIYTAPAVTQALIRTLEFFNTAGTPSTIFLYGNGTATTDRFFTATIPAGGTLTYGSAGWQMTDSTGAVVVTASAMTLTGDVTASGVSPLATTISNNVVSNAKLAQGAANTIKANPTNALANEQDMAFGVNTFLARASTGDLAAKAISDAGLAWAVFANSASQTAALDLATQTVKGLLSAADKKILDDLHYDFVADFGGVGNDSTDNLAAFNTALSTMPSGSTLFIPTGTYRVSGEITISLDRKITFKGAGRYASIIKTTSATANIFNISAVAWRNTWVDLGFLSTVNKTAGACIAITLGQAATFPTNTAVSNNVYRCWFSSDGGGTIFQAINYTGWQAGNLSVLADLDISGISNGGRGIFIFGSTINVMLHNITINGGAATTSASCEIQASGAVQVTACDWIQSTNAVLFNAATQLGAQACYFTNVFFDQPQADVIKVIGGFTTGRIKFTQCGIATATSGFSAVLVNGTGAGAVGTATALPAGISVVDCDIYHAAGGSTGAGITANGCQDINIQSCRVTGYSGAGGAGVNAIASAGGQTKIRVNGCIIGPNSNLTVTNTDGVKLSGAFGALSVTDNFLVGNTQAINDTSTMVAGAQKNINNNAGALAGFNASFVSAAGVALSATEAVLAQINAPANSLKLGTTIKFLITGTAIITVTTTIRVHIGTAGTVADAQILNVGPSAAGVAGGFVAEGQLQIGTPGAAAVGAGAARITTATTTGAVAPTFPGNCNTTIANIITLGALCSAAGHTVRSATLEIISPS